MRNRDAFVTVFDRGYGQECMYIPLDYNFFGSGNMVDPAISVRIETMTGGKILTLYLVDGQAGAARHFNTSQQQISRWVKKHLNVQRQIREKGAIRHVTIINK